jgi:hypothetical protein
VREETARTREFLAALLIEMPGEPETLRSSLWEGGRSGDGDATLPSHAKTLAWLKEELRWYWGASEMALSANLEFDENTDEMKLKP